MDGNEKATQTPAGDYIRARPEAKPTNYGPFDVSVLPKSDTVKTATESHNP